jgi:hypothetical protein
MLAEELFKAEEVLLMVNMDTMMAVAILVRIKHQRSGEVYSNPLEG